MSNLELYDQAFLESLDLKPEQLNAQLVYQSVPAWDSVGHMGLMAQLEEAFGIMMEIDDIVEFSGYEAGKEILAKYGVVVADVSDPGP